MNKHKGKKEEEEGRREKEGTMTLLRVESFQYIAYVEGKYKERLIVKAKKKGGGGSTYLEVEQFK